MIHLSVNLNAVAMLRNRRDVGWPDVTEIARVVLDAGADGITVHPRPDERHIRRTDVFELEEMLRADYPHAEYNIEGYPSPDFLDLIEKAAPDQATFVPDDPEQSTSDHGWDIPANEAFLQAAFQRVRGAGVRVALFINADPTIPALAREAGADRVELYTGPYGASFPGTEAEAHLQALVLTAKAGVDVGLEINAGHDLTLKNLPALISAVDGIAEVSIGHGITADALLIGFDEAVKRYKAVLSAAI